MATNNATNKSADTFTATTSLATTFDTNVAAAGATLAGTTLAVDGTDANISLTLTAKGTGTVNPNTLSVNSAYTLPTSDGNADDVFTTDGSGTVSWQPNAATGVASVAIQKFVYTGSAQTYTPTSGMKYCIIECLGSGGAGGGATTTGATTSSVGGGGGAGEYAKGLFSAATIGASQTVTISAGGTANAGATGGAGGNTSVGALISANGGSGGIGSAAVVNINAKGGAGGTGGAGGDVRADGSNGGLGYTLVTTTSASWTGAGANSQLGKGGISTGGTPTTLAGTAGAGYGAGGSGAVNWINQGTAVAGGAGAAGIVIVTEYI